MWARIIRKKVLVLIGKTFDCITYFQLLQCIRIARKPTSHNGMVKGLTIIVGNFYDNIFISVTYKKERKWLLHSAMSGRCCQKKIHTSIITFYPTFNRHSVHEYIFPQIDYLVCMPENISSSKQSR